MAPNTLLDAVLAEAGMSRAGLARRVNDLGTADGLSLHYDHTSVGRWARGQRPRTRVITLICRALGEHLGRQLKAADLGFDTAGGNDHGDGSLPEFVDRAPALWHTNHRHATLARDTPTLTGTPSIVPVWEWENPPHDADVSHRGQACVEAEDIDILRTARSHYERMYQQAGGVAARPRVVWFLSEHVAPALRGTYNDHIGRDLFRAAGGLIAVAGICSYDSDQQGLAQRYFHQALRMAKASGDHAFGGYVIALLVNQAIYLRDYRQAVAFAQAGIRTAGPHISAALATDLHAMQAKAFARMKQRDGAHASMREAETAASRILRATEPPETTYVQPGLVEAQIAETLLSLGDHRQALQYADAAVAAEAHVRGRVHRLATLTNVAVSCRQLDQAAEAAAAMLDSAQGIESRRLNDRLRSVHRKIAPYTDSGMLRSVAERVETVLSMPT